MDILERSLQLLDKYLSETPQEELNRLFQNVDSLDLSGPTVPEYFEDSQTILQRFQDSLGQPIETLPQEFLKMFDFDYTIVSMEEITASYNSGDIEYQAAESNYLMAA